MNSFRLKACCHYLSFPSKTLSKKTWTKCLLSLSNFFTLQNSLRLVIYSLRNTERVPFGMTQKKRSLRKGLENIEAHLKLSFVRDKYIPLKENT
jgi:hypothetical protein